MATFGLGAPIRDHLDPDSVSPSGGHLRQVSDPQIISRVLSFESENGTQEVREGARKRKRDYYTYKV